jgi:hypothetical protein
MALPVEELQAHPRGQIVYAGSQLMSATMGKFTLNPNVSLKHTLAHTPNGYVFGNEECSGTFDCDVSEVGPERDWIAEVKAKKVKKITFEIPTLQYEIEMVLGQIDLEVPLDNAVRFTVAWVGKIKKAVV